MQIPTAKKLFQFEVAKNMKDKGYSYLQIGHALGCSHTQARNIHLAALRWEERTEESLYSYDLEYLPERTKNALHNNGYTTRDAVRTALLSGEIHWKKSNIRNLGRKSYEILCDWVGLEWKEVVEVKRVKTRKLVDVT